MNLPDDKAAGTPGSNPGPANSGDCQTGLPLLRTWRGVYLFVLGSFVVWVLLLAALTLTFP
jgi:hypothetical protein